MSTYIVDSTRKYVELTNTWAKEVALQNAQTSAERKGQALGPLLLTPADLLLKYGTEWKQRKRYRGRRMLMKHCYDNAQRLCARRPELRYCEGYASSIITCEHGWCVDPQGNVIDPTWEEEKNAPDYFGVTLDLGFVRVLSRITGSSSALFDWMKWSKILPMVEEHLQKNSVLPVDNSAK